MAKGSKPHNVEQFLTVFQNEIHKVIFSLARDWDIELRTQSSSEIDAR